MSTVRAGLRLLGIALRGEGVPVAAGLALLVGSTAAALLQPWPLKLVIDSVLGSESPPALLATASRPALLGVLAAVVIALQIVVGALAMLGTNFVIRAALRMVFRLRCALFEHLQKLSLSFHDATKVGDSLYRVAWDTYAVQTLLNNAIVPATTATLTLVGIAVVMALRDWRVTVAALAIAGPLVMLIRRLDRPMTRYSLRVHERESDVSSRVQEALTAIRAVQAFAREPLERERFERQAAASLHANLHLTLLQTGSQMVVAALMAVGTAAVLWLAGRRALAGALTPGDVVLLAAYLVMLYKPLETLAYTAVAVQGAAAGARRVLALLDVRPDVTDAPGAAPLPGRAFGGLAFEHVTFAYGAGEPALRDVSLDVRPGEVVAIVGASGAGKTTLASLVVRFYDPQAGRITLDGYDLRALTLRSLRENVALVLQDPIVFGATIRENIAYGRPAATAEEVERAARAANAHEFIAALPEGYATVVGERGVTLSGGQRQRVAIARAFVKDAPVLILDEPTSALDAENERAILEALARLMKGRTTLIIAHRLSTIRHADRIVVLEGGVVVEQGTHTELLARPRVYARLHSLQAAPVTP
ncbi:MAG: ABC transporter ATP-binding protein [Candidatus Rokuibacteriota bacterium]|nr:MAG: ABC transporter ATP-binding protein [Candidatus Rokubacteria bacterium]